MKCRFKIRGLDCANCAAELERKLNKLDGIDEANINFMTERMELELYDDEDKDEIIKRVKKLIKKEEPDVTIDEL